MILKSVRVRNYRCIADETLECDDLTVLAGPNGSGKSAFLRALESFYGASPKVTVEDFYGEDTTVEMTIAVSFTDLTDEEKNLFRIYIQAENLTVERVISLRDNRLSAKYHGSTLQNPAFAAVREAEGAARKREAYTALRNQARYQDLPAWTNQAAALEALRDWEAGHPEACAWQRDEGQFFGFTEVAQGRLDRFTRFLLVPAVRDASEDAAEGKGSVLSDIMDLVVRSVLVDREDIKELREQTQARYKEILDPRNLAELQALGEKLTATLQTYAPDAKVELSWDRKSPVDIPLPKADVKLVEDAYAATVGRTGHGLQRAFILTMLQHLAVARAPVSERQERQEEGRVEAREGTPTGPSPMPNLIMAIEEPELYQHPSRQRRFAKILMDLATGGIRGVADRTQLIYSTHSALFVGLEWFEQLRLLRKVERQAGRPKATQAVQTTLEEIAREIWEADGRPAAQYTGATLRPRLQAIMTPWMNEGFFADSVVLVEGEQDRAAILGVAFAMGHDLESEGHAVIPCGGKSNLHRPMTIFRKLQIPVYVIWDGDRGGNGRPEENRRLLRLLGQAEEDWPLTRAADKFACFETKLEEVLRDEIGGGLFDRLIAEWQDEFGISKREQALKNPVAIRTVIEKAKAERRTSGTLENIVGNVLALCVRG